MYRIEWIQNREHFAIVTDGTPDEALAMFLNARANLQRERDEETQNLLNKAADALGRLAEHLIPQENQS